MTNVRKTDDKNQIFIICLYLTMFFRAAIRLGLLFRLDVSLYAKKEFNWPQMDTIFKGLLEGLDVSIYAKPEISAKQMIRIREQLLKESTL